MTTIFYMVRDLNTKYEDLQKYYKSKESFTTNPDGSSGSNTDISMNTVFYTFLVFLLILIIRVFFLVYAIIFIRRCFKNMLLKVVLVLAVLFIPGVAELLVLGVLLAGGCASTNKSSKKKSK
jgi:hypothetical protein